MTRPDAYWARGHALALAAFLAIFLHFCLLFLLNQLSSVSMRTKAKMPVRMHVYRLEQEYQTEKAETVSVRQPENSDAAVEAPCNKSASPARKQVIRKNGEASSAGKQKLSARKDGHVAKAPASTTLSRAPMPDKARKNIPPAYPVLARKRGNEGTVILRCLVDESGNVANAEIAVGSGFRILDEAAKKAALRWHFLPATLDGRPVWGALSVPVEFRLE